MYFVAAVESPVSEIEMLEKNIYYKVYMFDMVRARSFDLRDTSHPMSYIQ